MEPILIRRTLSLPLRPRLGDIGANPREVEIEPLAEPAIITVETSATAGGAGEGAGMTAGFSGRLDLGRRADYLVRAADSDVAPAVTQCDGASSPKAAATAQEGQVAGLVAPAAHQPATIRSIRDALVTVIARQEQILQAIVQLAVHRTANDESTLSTYVSLLWLARLASGRTVD